MRSTEIGCAQSHRAVASWLAASEHDMALILEDDVVPQFIDLKSMLRSVVEDLRAHAQTGAAFICHLGAPSRQTRLGSRRKVVRKARPWSEALPIRLWLHTDPGYGLWFAHAYLLSKGAALRQVRLEPKIRTLADDWRLRREIGLLDEIFFTQPILFAQDQAIPSTIRTGSQNECFGTSKAESVSFSQRLSESIRKVTFPRRAMKSIRFRGARALAKMQSVLPYRVE